LKPALAKEVAIQLQKTDAVEAHARDELGITSHAKANPIQAMVTSALAFAVGSLVPIAAAIFANTHMNGNGAILIVIVSLVALAISGMIGTIIGGGNRLLGAFRVFAGGGIAMAVTYLIGHIVGANL
jgi:VIT1/CCC1 family predicted Fe2+/Mn2+ transporter